MLANTLHCLMLLFFQQLFIPGEKQGCEASLSPHCFIDLFVIPLVAFFATEFSGYELLFDILIQSLASFNTKQVQEHSNSYLPPSGYLNFL